MKLTLFQELVDLNRAFEEVLRGLERMERVRHFQSDLIRYARADVETARVDANREFFDNFEVMVEDDASWAYEFQREYNQKAKDPDDVYLEVKDSEERRKRKGLAPRVVILAGWDMSDEERYDEQQAEKKRQARKKVGATRQRKPSRARAKGRARTDVALTSEGEASQ
jgi:hypothetical protein